MFKRKKSLKQISLSDLKMLDAQLEYQIQSTTQDIKDTSALIAALLKNSQDCKEEYEQKTIAREITTNVEQQRDLLQKLETVETKRRAVLRLISIKEADSPLFSEKSDILDGIDLDSVEKLVEDSEVKKEVRSEHAKAVLKKLEDSDDYERILSIVKSTSLDGEDIVCAQAEIEDLTLKKNNEVSSDLHLSEKEIQI